MADKQETPEPKVDKRIRMIKHPSSGEMVKRVDYIRELADPNGDYNWTRRQIADHLTDITGEEVRYQIVFAATKDMDVKKAERKKPKADADIDEEEVEEEETEE